MPDEFRPLTLRELGGLPTRADGLAGTAIVVIDAQHEYLDGELALPAVGPAPALSCEQRSNAWVTHGLCCVAS